MSFSLTDGIVRLNTFYIEELLNNTGNDSKTELYYVLLHEIGHLFGINSFAFHPNFLDNVPIYSYIDIDGSTKYAWQGENALREYKKSFAKYFDSSKFIGIPIEDDGGAGTAHAHPEEGSAGRVSTNNRYINNVFHPGLEHELMAGWSEYGNYSPLSSITIGFLDDIGYNVNYLSADPYDPFDPTYGIS